MIIVVVIIPLLSFAAPDTTWTHRYGVKLYVNSSPGIYYHDISGGGVNYAFANTGYIRPSVAAYKVAANRNIHELELSGLEINKLSDKKYDPFTLGPYFPSEGRQQTVTNIALRYEYIIVLNKRKNPCLAPAIGLAAMPYYMHYRITPMVTSNFPVSAMYTGLQFAVVPRLNINTNKRLFFDVNVPLTLANVYYERTWVQNPVVPQNRRSKSVVNANLGPVLYSVRLGIGLKI